jgi:hypothetical protein
MVTGTMNSDRDQLGNLNSIKFLRAWLRNRNTFLGLEQTCAPQRSEVEGELPQAVS